MTEEQHITEEREAAEALMLAELDIATWALFDEHGIIDRFATQEEALAEADALERLGWPVELQVVA